MTSSNRINIDATRELLDLQDALTEYQSDIVKHVSTGKPKKCTDEIMAFCMRHVCKISPIWMYGERGKRHFYIRPTSVSRALRRFNEEYREQLRACVDRFELAETVFRFDDSSEPCSLFALQCILGDRMLLDDSVIDSLYIPIHKDDHFSLLIISVPRQRIVHLDSLGFNSHQEIASNVVEMFLSAKMLKSTRFAMRMAKTRTQKEEWECGWCVPLFSRWWRLAKPDADIDDATKASLEHSEIKKLCSDILKENDRVLELQNYARRVDLHCDAIAAFAKTPSVVNGVAKNVSVSQPDNSSDALNID